MKLLLIAVTLASASATFSSSEQFLGDIKGAGHDAGAVMAKLTGMMGDAQQKLAVAQRHHKKVVKKIRNEAAAMLEQEANVYGKYLHDYNAELAASTAELQKSVDLAKAGLAKAEASSASVNDWKDPEVEQRAKLGAQVSAAERNIKRAERRTSRAVREGEERAEENLEDSAQKLGMKLGDMTPLVDKSKKTLEAVAEKETPVKTVATKEASASKKVDLKALEDGFAKATKNQQAKTAEGNKKLDGFLTKTDKEVADKAKKVQGDLETAQKAEIAKVLGRKPEAVAPVVKAAAKKVVEKTSAKKAATKDAAVKKPVTEVKAAAVAVKAAPAKAAPAKVAPAKAAPAKATPVKK